MSGKTYQAVVVGASGYAGAETVRLLASHPSIEVTAVTSSRNAGSRLDAACPWLATDLVLSEFDPNAPADIFFLCQESGFAAENIGRLKGRKAVDLSPDFRLEDGDIYQAVYKRPWPGAAPYGLPELGDRGAIASADLVANPGCFATVGALALAPIVRNGMAAGVPVIDAKSGVSGAGRSKSDTAFTFSEIEGSFRPYAVVGHRHTPEIEQLCGTKIRFTPHLVPMTRGIEVTLHVPVGEGLGLAELTDAFQSAYGAEPLVRLTAEPPATKQVYGSCRCDISVQFDAKVGFAVICAAIDNLGKGASGQAIQNANLMLGLPETLGLPIHGVWP